MKKFSKTLTLFLLLLILSYPILIFIWGTFAPRSFKPNISFRQGDIGFLNTRIKEIKNYQNVDILFVGSSHAYRGFDNRFFTRQHLTSFNLGSSAQTPLETNILLSRYLDQLNPKVVVYEVYPQTFTSDGVESALDIISNDKNDFSSFKLAITLNDIKVYNTLLYSMIRERIRPNASFRENSRQFKDQYISGGYVEHEVEYFRYKPIEKKAWKFNEKQFDAFRNNYSMVINKNIRLMLVYAPVTSAMYNSYSKGYIFDSIMGRFSNYFNFNTLLKLNDSLNFLDEDHLNQTGVEKFDSAVLSKLKEKLFINFNH